MKSKFLISNKSKNKSSISPVFSGKAFVLILIIVLCASLVRLLPLTRSLNAIDGHFMPDDTYLALEISKSIGLGKGPWYEANYTNGYQPLYVLLSSYFYSDFDEVDNSIEDLDLAVKQSIAVVILFDLITLCLLAIILSRLYGWSMPTYLGCAIWALHPYIIGTALNGLETSMAITLLLLVSLFWGAYAREASGLFPRLMLGVLIGLGVLSRIDFAIVGFWILVIELYDAYQGRKPKLDAIKALVFTFIGFLLSYSPWLLWSHSYTGAWLPVSGPAVRMLAFADFSGSDLIWFYPLVLLAAIVYPITKAPIIYLFAAFLFLISFYLRKKGKPHLLGLLKQSFHEFPLIWFFTFSLLLAYGLYHPAWWFFTRYLFVTVIIAIFILTAFAHKWSEYYSNKAIRFLPLLILTACIFNSDLVKPLVGDIPNPGKGYRDIGLWVRENVEEGSVIGSMQSGAIAYYAEDLQVLNLDGVVNGDALQALRAKNMENYLKNYDADYFIGWPTNTRYLQRHTFSGKGEQVDFLEPIAELKRVTWGNPKTWTLYKVNLVDEHLNDSP